MQTEQIITYFKLEENDRRYRYLSSDAAALLHKKMFGVGDSHIIILNDNGSVSALGDNSAGQCNVSGWTDIVKVAAGKVHSVALRRDGTVLAAGDNAHGQCNVAEWKNITDIFAINDMTVAVTGDGQMLVSHPRLPSEYFSPTKRMLIKRLIGEMFLYTELSGGFYRVYQYIGNHSMISIPESVAVIDERTFYQKMHVCQIDIPNSVVKIGAEAFRKCPGLAFITIPKAVIRIDENAFDSSTQVRCFRGTYGEEYARRYLMNYKIID